MTTSNIIFWDSHTKTWRARMEFSFQELGFIADNIPVWDTARHDFYNLADEIQRQTRAEREDFND